MRYSVAVIAPARLSAWTLGMVEAPVCGSTATIESGLADVVDGRGDEDDPVGQRAAQSRHVAALPAGVVEAVAAAGVDDQLVARRLDRPRGALEQLGAERLDVGDEDPEHVGAMAAQAAGDQARLVAELGDHRLDPRRPSRRRRRSGR